MPINGFAERRIPASNKTVERVAHLEERIAQHDVAVALRPKVDREALMDRAWEIECMRTSCSFSRGSVADRSRGQREGRREMVERG